MAGFFRYGAITLLVLFLTACGGGGDTFIGGNHGTDTTGSGTDNGSGTDTGTTVDGRVKELEITASSFQLASDGSNPVIISAIAKDENNNTINDTDILFAVDNGATIEPEQVVVNEEGTAVVLSALKTAQLTPGLNRPENRTLTVTVTAGNLTRTLEVDVVGTTLLIDGPERIVSQSPTRFTIKLKDAASKGLSNQLVTVSSDSANLITPVDDYYTDSDGEVQFDYTASVSGSDTIRVSALGADFSHSVDISGDNFSLSSPREEIIVNTTETVSLLCTRDGIPQANRTIYLATTRGTVPHQVITDSQGRASFSFSSSTAGGTVITAVDNSTSLTTSMVREFIAITPNDLSLQTERTMLAPNGQVTLFAIVHDADHNPVKNQRVNFVIEADTVNGRLSSPSAITDSLGRASVVYTAGDGSSALDGVRIRAALQTNAAMSDTLSLTVGERSMRIVMGTNAKVEVSDVYYRQSFGVIVTDSAGNPVANQEVKFAITPTRYLKGELSCGDTHSDGTTISSWHLDAGVWCESEDTNVNGWMDAGEDYNNNQTLDPTHAATVTGSGLTDTEGKLTVPVTYPQSHGWWNEVRLTATTTVEGTEFMESTKFVLGVAAGDTASCESDPPNRESPYGFDMSCESPY